MSAGPEEPKKRTRGGARGRARSPRSYSRSASAPAHCPARSWVVGHSTRARRAALARSAGNPPVGRGCGNLVGGQRLGPPPAGEHAGAPTQHPSAFELLPHQASREAQSSRVASTNARRWEVDPSRSPRCRSAVAGGCDPADLPSSPSSGRSNRAGVPGRTSP